MYKSDIFTPPRSFPRILYLSTEAGEEDLTVLVFVSQLLGDAGEAGAGLRAVSHLQEKGKAGIITRSRLMPPATVQTESIEMKLDVSRKTLGDLSQPLSSLFITLIP